MQTFCSKCGGKIKYTKVLKEETVRVPNESGCCLVSMLLTLCTCGLSLLASYVSSFKRVTKCVLVGTCVKCGKTYQFDCLPDEDDMDDEDYSSEKYSHNDLCKSCIYAKESLNDSGWCDEIGDYADDYTNCEGYE